MHPTLQSRAYAKLIDESAQNDDLKKLDGKTVLVAGAAGGIGSFLIDALMRGNASNNNHIRVIAVGRNIKNLETRFSQYPDVTMHAADISSAISLDSRCDFIVNAASNTHPVQYASYPIETIMTNITGTRNLLELALRCEGSRFILLSSVEIYGQNKGDTDKFSEDYSGYIDCNTLRAGYPESKRAAEALCQAYISEKNADAVTLRLSRAYGPTMAPDDSKAIAQMIRNAVNGEDVVLKSDGTPYYSYAFIADAVSALQRVMLYGKTGEVYNAASDESDAPLSDLAAMLADLAKVRVVHSQPEAKEARGFSKATKALLNTEKLKRLGWKSRYSLPEGLALTVEIMKELTVQKKG